MIWDMVAFLQALPKIRLEQSRRPSQARRRSRRKMKDMPGVGIFTGHDKQAHAASAFDESKRTPIPIEVE